MKKTKIVCTIGPASDSVEILLELMKAGMNVCRLNFSHGSHEEHLQRIKNIIQARETLDMPVAILLDTKGPEIRLGDMKEEPVDLAIGDEFTLTTRPILGDRTIASISYQGLTNDAKIGDRILIDDGLLELQIVAIEGTEIYTRAMNYGSIKSRKGVNVPEADIQLPSMTEADIADIKFGVANNVDFIAASFIRQASDVLGIRKILEDNGGSHIRIIAKIECQEAVNHLDEIIAAADGTMVARGDLGVEIQTEQMPIIQKEIIRKTSLAGKPVITATQMLDSMTRNPRPTRAEVTDVANAILDGTDAIMLSGETAVGKYPVETVKIMHRIAVTTEESVNFQDSIKPREVWINNTTTNSISRSTVAIASQLKASAIIANTTSGATARAISQFRPNALLLASIVSEQVMRQMALIWGVHPIMIQKSESTDEMIERSIVSALDKGYIQEGQLVVLTAGVPLGYPGTTNLIKVHTVGDILLKGTGIGKKPVVGRVCIGGHPTELKSKCQEGDILVAASTDPAWLDVLRKISGLVVEEKGLTSYAAIQALELKKPAIVGVEQATSLLDDGQLITLDPNSGLIYNGEARVL